MNNTFYQNNHSLNKSYLTPVGGPDNWGHNCYRHDSVDSQGLPFP